MSNRTILVVALVVALAAAGSAAAARHTSSGARAGRHSAGGTTINLRKTKLGKVLVTKSGRTLYMYAPDKKNKSNCYSGCASVWPPLISKAKARAGKGVKAKLIGVAMRKNGQHQVTYKGHPLYTFTSDSKAGEVNGEGYGGIWYVLSASGKAVKHASGGSTRTTTTGGGGGGYGGY
jgi:predicted lipoprotein with Yx(FWY)xxD motif